MLPLSTIASAIPNSGTYTWTPSLSLEPDVTHYGLKLVVDATGEFQYSTQFGISGSTGPSSPSPSASASASASATGAGPVSQYPDGQPLVTGTPAPVSPSGYITVSANATATSTYCPPTYVPSGSLVPPPVNGTSYAATAGPTMVTSTVGAGAGAGGATTTRGFNSPSPPTSALPLPSTGAGEKLVGQVGFAGMGVMAAALLAL